jgi:hypothetical protein
VRGWLIAAALAVAACFAIAFTQGIGADYGNIDCHLRDQYCDDAQPSLDALSHGDLHGFFARQPLMGPVTLALRAPFAALAGLDDYNPKLVYRLGALACLLAMAAVALLLAAVMRARGHPAWQQALCALLLLVNPITFRTLEIGHPEEIVGSALCVATVIAFTRDRHVLAGLLLGGALATKLWAILIVPALLLAFVDRRALVRFSLAAALVVAILYAPMVAGDAGRLHATLTSANKLGTNPGTVTSANVWWFVGSEKAGFDRATGVSGNKLVFEHDVGFRLRDNVARITHPLVVLLAALFAVLWARSAERRARPETLLLLFALIFLTRCILDPGNLSYYHLPAVASLVAYEALAYRRPPWAALWLMACLQAMTSLSPHIHSDAGFGLLYLGWALPTAAGLAFWLYRRRPLSAGNGASERGRAGAEPAAGLSTAS